MPSSTDVTDHPCLTSFFAGDKGIHTTHHTHHTLVQRWSLRPNSCPNFSNPPSPINSFIVVSRLPTESQVTLCRPRPSRPLFVAVTPAHQQPCCDRHLPILALPPRFPYL